MLAASRLLLPALLTLLLFGIAQTGHARIQVEVIETDPSGSDVLLDLNQNFSLKIAYDTDEPVNIWARPYYKGNQVPAMSNASAKYEGRGHVLGWFALTEPAEVDEVRILVGRDGVTDAELALTYPVTIHAGTDNDAPAESPVWVNELLDQNRAAQAEQAQARMNEPIEPSDIVFMTGFIVAVMGLGLSGIVAPAVAYWRWEGRWRIAAAIPGLLLILVIGRIIIDTSINPKSHNLWPFEILIFGFISAAFIAILTIARYLHRRSASRTFD